MTFTNTIKVDVGHPWKTAQVYVKQGDKDSRKIRAELMNGAASWTIPVGTVATFRAKKPDDTVVTQDATISSPNIVEVVLDEQVGAVFGVVRGEIRLVNGGEILNTFLISINVEAAAVTDEDIVSRDVLDEYQALVEQMLAVAGSPLVANAAADMTDKTRVYVYTGSEAGYVTGDWYYWDGAAWTAGGAYNSQGIGDAFIEQTAEYIKQSTVATESDRTPYLYRATPNPSAILADEKIVGGTVAFNQLCNSASVTVPNGHKYYLLKAGVSSITASTGSAVTGLDDGTDMVIDLTAMLGSTIADYLNTLESGTPGAGVAKLREWGFLSKEYFAYDAGSLKSVNTSGKRVTGKNVFDNSGTTGTTSGVTFTKNADGTWTTTGTASSAAYRKIGEVPVIPGYKYTYSGSPSGASSSTYRIRYRRYVNGVAQSWAYINATSGTVGPYVEGTEKLEVEANVLSGQNVTGKVWKPMFEIGETATTFEPYRTHTYPTTPTDLNGIFKLDSNNQLYADGDVYASDGTITRKFEAVDLGTKSWSYSSTAQAFACSSLSKPNGAFDFVSTMYTPGINTSSSANIASQPDKTLSTQTSNANIFIKDSAYGTDAAAFKTAMNGVYLVYELATPTTETATPYTACQISGKGGTEEWIDSRAVPVPVGHETVYGIGIPDVPANASNATLKATVTNGKTLLSWS